MADNSFIASNEEPFIESNEEPITESNDAKEGHTGVPGVIPCVSRFCVGQSQVSQPIRNVDNQDNPSVQFVQGRKATEEDDSGEVEEVIADASDAANLMASHGADDSSDEDVPISCWVDKNKSKNKSKSVATPGRFAVDACTITYSVVSEQQSASNDDCEDDDDPDFENALSVPGAFTSGISKANTVSAYNIVMCMLVMYANYAAQQASALTFVWVCPDFRLGMLHRPASRD